MNRRISLIAFGAVALLPFAHIAAADNTPPNGFVALFNGKDLDGWKGLVGNPLTRAKMTPEQLAAEQKKADDIVKQHWLVKDGVLIYDGEKVKGAHLSLCTIKDYGDFEMWCDWKIEPKGDSGIYLRGTPQVQIWDPKDGERNAVGSGGLFNNKLPENPSTPLVVADSPVGEWNTFFIRMVGDKVTVKLNGKLVVDNVALENYWDRAQPIFPTGQIELQDHGTKLYFKNIYVRELNDTTANQGTGRAVSAKRVGPVRAIIRRVVNRNR